MPKRSSKPYEANVTPFSIVQQVTSGPAPVDLSDAEIRRRIMQEMGRRGGKKGGKARAKALTKSKRCEIARAAALKRWAKKK